MVADAYGDTDSARRYYERVKKPKRGLMYPSTSYALAQARLVALRTP